MTAHYTQKKGATRSITFDFTPALNENETISAQSTSIGIHRSFGDSNSLGSITNIVRNSDNNKVSLNYSNTEVGYYVISVTATCTQQIIKLDTFIQVVD